MPILGVPDARPTRGVCIAGASRVLGMLSLGLALIAFGVTSAKCGRGKPDRLAIQRC
jgi:hypothetical protein